MTTITVPCATCSVTGWATHEDRHTETRQDQCRACGGTGQVPARPGESRATSWPDAVPGAGQSPVRQEEGGRRDEAGGEALKAACEPWKFGVGDPPDDGNPLIGPYSAGIGYAIDRLAKLTNAGQYVGADGSETFEGDVDGTIMNVLRAARLYDDETGAFGKVSAPDATSGGEAPGSVIPEGWVLVPREPTERMLHAAMDAPGDRRPTAWERSEIPEYMRWIWLAMLSASPRPSSKEGQGDA